ncbi:hypothetical protein Theam_1754 (plasmid) [Thermovibrio ammonificans HB-1]|uniref:Uncharacterized protein n=1 Tax=Thermovibrio ammonificans (strain DSM 15698 / JCM 12110 / HB-1) TaxID=648996 RepID=E8T6Y9_THEA1|nr:hypothetical protein [Thermovibrio ammonificans]ADU97710.1 hypothetical protein Theam_1754 [Thermovibrio ammonificans HB-1]
MLIKPLMRFRDESVGGVREGALTEADVPDRRTIYYQARIDGRTYSGIRVFHRLGAHLTLWRVNLEEMKEELLEGWEKVVDFVEGREVSIEPFRPVKLSLIYGEGDFSPYNYCTVRTFTGSFTFVEADTEESARFGFPVRDLKGRDLEVASVLFSPPLHSFLSLRALNLLR